jgi:hypothetical protein
MRIFFIQHLLVHSLYIEATVPLLQIMVSASAGLLKVLLIHILRLGERDVKSGIGRVWQQRKGGAAPKERGCAHLGGYL